MDKVGAIGLFFLFFLGCAGTTGKRKPVLTREDKVILRKAEMEIGKGGLGWKTTLKRVCEKESRARVFAKGLVGWLVRDFERLGLHPDVFQKELEKNPNSRTWKRILQALESMGNVSVGILMTLIEKGRDSFAREMGAEILGRLGRLGVEELGKGIENGSPQVAYACARALGLKKGCREAFRILRNGALKHKDPLVRGTCAYYLGRYGGRQALEVLLQVMASEKQEFPKRKAVLGLGELGFMDALPVLIDYLQESKKADDVKGIQAASRALRNITGRNFGSNVRLWKLYWASKVKKDDGE